MPKRSTKSQEAITTLTTLIALWGEERETRTITCQPQYVDHLPQTKNPAPAV